MKEDIKTYLSSVKELAEITDEDKHDLSDAVAVIVESAAALQLLDEDSSEAYRLNRRIRLAKAGIEQKAYLKALRMQNSVIDGILNFVVARIRGALHL